MINSGFFLITDISGYTQFLTESELIHANEILQSLFQSQLEDIKAPFHITSYRGDAIQSYAMGEDLARPEMILEMIESIYYKFQDHLRQSAYNTTCECTACSNIRYLDLKFFVHYGEFLLSEIGDAQELQGADVIMAHRLMKNRVTETFGIDGYALFTQPAIQVAGIGEFAKTMMDHEEEYEHVGRIKLKIYDLEKAWEEEQKKQKEIVTPEDAWISGSIDLPVPKEIAWDHLTDNKAKEIFLKMDSISVDNLVNGRVKESTTFHCVHGSDEIFHTVIGWSPFDFYTTRDFNSGMTYNCTFQLKSIDATNSRLELRYSKPEADEFPMPLDEIKSNAQESLKAALEAFHDYVIAQVNQPA